MKVHCHVKFQYLNVLYIHFCTIEELYFNYSEVIILRVEIFWTSHFKTYIY